MSDRDGRALAIAELIRIYGPWKAAELVREVDKRAAQLRAGGVDR